MSTAAHRIRTLVGVFTTDANYLFHLPPMWDGLPAWAAATNSAVTGPWLAQYGVSLAGGLAGPFIAAEWGGSLAKGNSIYLHVLNWPGETLLLPPLALGRQITGNQVLNRPLVPTTATAVRLTTSAQGVRQLDAFAVPAPYVRTDDAATGDTRIDVSDHEALFRESLAGVRDLIKTGAGTLSLIDAAGYSGATRVLAGTLRLRPPLTNAVVQGTLIGTGNVTVNGTLRLVGDATLSFTGGFTNHGVLDLITWSGTLPAGFVNHGVVLDRSALVITSFAEAGGDVLVTITGYAGHNYQLQRSDTLPGGWQDVGAPQAGAGMPLDFSDAIGDGQTRGFYRIKVNPRPHLGALETRSRVKNVHETVRFRHCGWPDPWNKLNLISHLRVG
jgi:autotransporter-associated beta strand protein